MKIKDILKDKDSLYILSKILNIPKSKILLMENNKVPEEYFEIKNRLLNNYPIEYIFNEAYFYKDKFFIQEGVLIPRDDTEVVLEKAIEIIEKEKLSSAIDCCTGSGIIAISLAKYTNLKKIIATDISSKAIETTNKNALIHKVNITIKQMNLFNEYSDLLIANPPYVESSHKKPNKFEPDEAFFAGEDGLDIIEELIKKAFTLKIPHIILEIGYNQTDKLIPIIENYYKKYEFFRDLQGNYRGVYIKR